MDFALCRSGRSGTSSSIDTVVTGNIAVSRDEAPTAENNIIGSGTEANQQSKILKTPVHKSVRKFVHARRDEKKPVPTPTLHRRYRRINTHGTEEYMYHGDSSSEEGRATNLRIGAAKPQVLANLDSLDIGSQPVYRRVPIDHDEAADDADSEASIMTSFEQIKKRQEKKKRLGKYRVRVQRRGTGRRWMKEDDHPGLKYDTAWGGASL
ncbi:hypothetical protein B0T16DRAFT_392217 [Cercophora newfieldiana]|uniref:Uncharacterized protein n=1 Tax=Cercophora newfieldiana TaxID=92897 RepID=A0AA39Y3A7_9PEZI|nr:hypothetical protein B0T16DRAFT_392217 [Cercophora newfieldiana]